MNKLGLSFFRQETTKVAQKLLGCVLVRKTNSGDLLKGLIVETEAYLGLKDDTCHSFGGKKTKRTKTMYSPGGVAYVYFTYGMYYCFNIVTANKEDPSAVLIRAVQPLAGIPILKKNRGKNNILDLASGPGKLCQAFQIDKNLNGEPLNGRTLSIEKHLHLKNTKPFCIRTSPRVGISPTKDGCYWPLRFYIKENPFVSQTKFK